MKQKFPIFVIANNIRSLANVGSFFRISDAANIQKLYLCGITGHPRTKNDKRLSYQIEKEVKTIEKTAIKTIPFVDWEYRKSTLDTIKELKKKGMLIVSVEQTDKSESLWEVKLKFPLCLIFGHERMGVDKEILAQSGLTIDIPMFGKGKSLNVASAYAIVVYELLKKSL